MINYKGKDRMEPAFQIEDWNHSHVFDQGNPLAERNTLLAVLLTTAMMIADICGGWVFNSMALLADGWHMSSHALALGLSVFAYGAARRLRMIQDLLLEPGKLRCWPAIQVLCSL